jgi:hypothetical protein
MSYSRRYGERKERLRWLMKIFALVASVLLMLTTPTLAAEYRGRTIDGKKLPVKVYSYATGGVFDAEVEFKKNIATVYFVGGSQLMLRLNQPTITDSNSILGYGRVGQFPLGRSFSIGIGGDTGSIDSLSIGAGSLNDLWRITLAPGSLLP